MLHYRIFTLIPSSFEILVVIGAEVMSYICQHHSHSYSLPLKKNHLIYWHHCNLVTMPTWAQPAYIRTIWQSGYIVKGVNFQSVHQEKCKPVSFLLVSILNFVKTKLFLSVEINMHAICFLADIKVLCCFSMSNKYLFHPSIWCLFILISLYSNFF